MTEEKSSTLYLDKEDIEIIHSIVSRNAKETGEPMPDFKFADSRKLEAVLNAPKRSFFGIEAYPTIFEKAGILFYSICKDQIFQNGNKRMSTACLLVFLSLNKLDLIIDPNELTKKALEVATTDAKDFQEIKKELTEWLQLSTSRSLSA